MTRVEISAVPPGAAGTMMVIGFSGHAAIALAPSPNVNTQHTNIFDVVFIVSPQAFLLVLWHCTCAL